MKGVCKNRQGFSALEALFAVMLLGLGFYGFLTMFSNTTSDTINDEYALVASRLASEKIEQLVANKASTGYASISNGTFAENVNHNSQSFTRKTVIRYVDAGDLTTTSVADTGYKRVDVDVEWDAGTTQNVSFSTLLTDY